MKATTRSTCCYCGVGCGVLIETETNAQGEAQIVGVQGDPDHPANAGRLCTKGSTLHLSAQPSVYAQTRVAYPQLRRSRADTRAEVSWDEALDFAAERWAQIIETHGPDTVGIYVSGQLLTEDYYVFNKLAKGLIGTNNIDTNSRLCMSSAVAGYKQNLGADAPPCSYEDFDHAHTLFISGSNMAYAHPILFRRVELARQNNPLMKIVVVDPRVTDTARCADLHLQIQPGTDVALYHGMLHIMLWEGWIDQRYIAAHTEGFDELKALVHAYAPSVVAQQCGITVENLRQAALWFANSPATLSVYCQGLNQSSAGTAKNTALINLHLATGQIGKPGAGPFSLTGQPNAMGGREVGGLANQLAAHRDLSNPEHRAEVAAAWGVVDVPAQPGLTAVPMFAALASGRLKAVWIVCTNPAQSLPDQNEVRAALEKAELVIVQEAYHTTATVAYADVLLPATTWGEKDGTVTNSERRISRVRAARPAYGQARHDWQIAVDMARRLQKRLPSRARVADLDLFPYQCPESIWNEHRELTRGRDLDITGMSYALLDSMGPLQWPMPQGHSQGLARLYTDGVFPRPNGKARFVAAPYRAVAEPINARYPLALNTGRLRDQWHGMSRTGTVARLNAHAPEPYVQIHPRDAERLGLQAGDLAHVASRRASVILPVQIHEEVGQSQVFVAMHWGQETVSGRAAQTLAYGVNSLCSPAIDPDSEQPEFKHAAVKLIKADLPWRLSAFAYLPSSRVLEVQQALRALLGEVAYGSVVLFGREAEGGAEDYLVGVALELADYEPCVADRQAWIVELMQLQSSAPSQHLLQYVDKRKSTTRTLLVVDQAQTANQLSSKTLRGAFLAGPSSEVHAAPWLKDLTLARTDVQALGRQLLARDPAAATGAKPRGKMVCTCFGVSQARIEEQLSAMAPGSTPQAALSHLQAALKCGTNCGSCVPEIQAIIKSHAVAAN